jgi:hypothetical protein
MDDESANPFLPYLGTIFEIVHEMWRRQGQDGYIAMEVRLAATAAARVSIYFSVHALTSSRRPYFPEVLARVNLWVRMSEAGTQPYVEGCKRWDAQDVSSMIVSSLLEDMKRRSHN